ncbi:hypothetical protein AAC387_Pa02g2150 [Persea americana]
MGVYRYWLENPRAVADFRAKYKIPNNVLVRLDNPEDLLDGSIFNNGWMLFWLVTVIEGGVRFPLHPLLKECLREWNLCACQLMPNGFKIIIGVVELNGILGINFGVPDIEEMYDLCKSGDIYLLTPKMSLCLINIKSYMEPHPTTNRQSCFKHQILTKPNKNYKIFQSSKKKGTHEVSGHFDTIWPNFNPSTAEWELPTTTISNTSNLRSESMDGLKIPPKGSM